MKARNVEETYDGQQLIVYIPDQTEGNLLVIEAGIGDNLSHDDEADGYVDYVNYYTSTMSMTADDPEEPEAEISYYDGGMMYFNTPVQQMTVGQVVSAVLRDFDDPEDAVLLKGGAA